MSNPVRILTVLLVGSLVVGVCLLAMYRRESNSARSANQELAELKIRLESVDGELASIKERFDQIHDVNPAIPVLSPHTPPADFSEAIRWLSQIVVQQSNMLAAVRGLEATPTPSVSPERAILIIQSGIARLNENLKDRNAKAVTARSRLVELINQLNIPDELAAVEISQALSMPSLQKYWPYFEAKREYEEAEDLARLVKRKLHVEELALEIQVASQTAELKQ